jgi:hypothetical protein
LLSLPVPQHDRVWEDYLFWITGILPQSSNNDHRANLEGSGGGADTDDNSSSAAAAVVVDGGGRRSYHKVKYGFDSPLVSSWRKRGWYNAYDSNTETTTTTTTLPIESAIRILRRYVKCYDTNYTKIMARICATRYSRYGEAAALLLQLLNGNNNGGGGGFISPNGTTRHELWLRFVDVCTTHPHEARVAGVDFDCIIRAVLQRRGRGRGGTSSLIGSSSSSVEMRNDFAVGFDLLDTLLPQQQPPQ